MQVVRGALGLVLCFVPCVGAWAAERSVESPKGAASASAPASVSAPATPSDAALIDRLIRQLGDPDYAARQKAQERLAQFGYAAFDALNAAADHEDFEVATRVRVLLRELESQWVVETDPAAVKRLLRDYGTQGARSRAAVMMRLSRLGDLMGVPSLCRMIRFERSPALSNLAAALILNDEPFDAKSKQRLPGLLRKELAGCKRPGGKWLAAYYDPPQGEAPSLAEFERCVQAEAAFCKNSPDGLAIATTIYLQYHLARAYAARGDRAKADEWARRAREFAGSTDESRFDVHSRAAMMLRRFGFFEWSELECMQLVQSGHPIAAFFGWSEIAEMHFEQADYAKAAEARKKAAQAGQGAGAVSPEWEMRRRTAMARMHYFYACAARERSDPGLERRYIEQAIAADPGEVDALIGAFRLKDSPPEFRRRIEKLIEQRAATLREEIAAEPDDPEAYNGYAWLIGNTQGNSDEALEMSKKSLELSPGLGSYLDTLAHVYFAKGDLQNAVAYQSQAAEREPHSRLIAAELKMFQAALKEKKK